MNVDLIVSIYLDRGSTPLGSIILQKNRLILVNKAIFSGSIIFRVDGIFPPTLF